jgi:cell wall-associated NlpC family hydrolase
LLFVFISCGSPDSQTVLTYPDSAARATVETVKPAARLNTGSINTGKTTPVELVTFARTLTGTPYKYGSTDPAQGFDCSGFVTYVFNHFGIVVPRSSPILQTYRAR